MSRVIYSNLLHSILEDEDFGDDDTDIESIKKSLKGLRQYEINSINGSWTLLHRACYKNKPSVVSLLLAQPNIEVNFKDSMNRTPFWLACSGGYYKIIRTMCEDTRVDINGPMKDVKMDWGTTPLSMLASCGRHNCIEWMIASNRYLDMGIKDTASDVLGEVDKVMGLMSLWNTRDGMELTKELCDRFKKDPKGTRLQLRRKLGICDEWMSGTFALIVFVSDKYLRLSSTCDFQEKKKKKTARFFSIARRLPMELQMVLCHRLVGSPKTNITGKMCEVAFKDLVKKLFSD